MGIKLDWQIEAEQTQQTALEDADSKAARRRQRRRMILAIIAVGVCIGGALIAAFWRLNSYEETRQDELRAAVLAEISALRIGNLSAFMEMQRSASEPWIDGQRQVFQDYQVLKQSGRLGDYEIVDITINEERGRVVVREQIDGRSYEQVWFYWFYEPPVSTPTAREDRQTGWRHVPADVEFWGNEKTIDNEHSQITYFELDGEIAEALADKIDRWWAEGCGYIGCPTEPGKLELIIDPQPEMNEACKLEESRKLCIISPYLNQRVLTDSAVPPGLEKEIATLLAQRLIRHASQDHLQFPEITVINFDGEWIKYQIQDWLVGKFIGQPVPFIDTINQVWGADAVGKLVANLYDTRPINALVEILEPTAAQLPDIGNDRLSQIDWTAFFHWRMDLERKRLLANNTADFYALYEFDQGNLIAGNRAADPAYRNSPVETIQTVTFTSRGTGIPAVLIDVTDSSGIAAQYQFVWNGQTFIRAN